MYAGGSISPPREPPRKVRVIPRRSAAEKMTGEGTSSSGSGAKESSLVWPMLDRANYAEWVMIMQCNLEAFEIQAPT
jgi:hypothetical protein